MLSWVMDGWMDGCGTLGFKLPMMQQKGERESCTTEKQKKQISKNFFLQFSKYQEVITPNSRKGEVLLIAFSSVIKTGTTSGHIMHGRSHTQ